ncbi:penicillin-binding protein 1B [Desulfogranum japonicum]|uniref:penicillin-binding protein 1B n=1 Tax=Desulfogranum japonicum TaxID=231447 RepID=UPI0004009682|nr:penicillin-binding protein 1B [Desulfogranum japonicum]
MTKSKTPKKHPWRWFALFILIFLISAIFYVYPDIRDHIHYLDTRITDTFEKNRWAIPARVYARPLEITQGNTISLDELEYELQLASYSNTNDLPFKEGNYYRENNKIEIKTRPFTFLEGHQQSQHCLISFTKERRVAEIVDLETHEILDYLRFDPITIGSFLPENFEDRILIGREEIPDIFLQLLLAVEDQNFYNHYGISIKGISRAMLQNIRAGKTVAGGSTLTQQLVKNHFLSNERTFKRKLNEMIMSLLLEKKYTKHDILVAYCNEIFMGQDGKRAIHGFSLASQHYFNKDLKQLSIDQIAMLVGMVKGPSYYNPVLHPQRAKNRRDVVLKVARDKKLITEEQYNTACNMPVVLHEQIISGINAFPSFIDLVQRKLLLNYDRKKLTNDGLQIFTTLNPTTQRTATEAFQTTIQLLTQQYNIPSLEGAFLITDRNTGEILAMSGGKSPSVGSYNRCLDAKRQIGSLIKPAVYLTALQNGYSLTSPVSDTAVTITDTETGLQWQPKNYSGREHGQIYLYQGLEKSLNLATVHLGMQLGVHSVLNTLNKLGVEEEFQPYPSILLGSEEMTPITVLQMYQTIATGGFYTPLRAIREVLDNQNNIIQNNGIILEQRFKSEDMWLLQFALQRVVKQGTAKRLQQIIPTKFNIAGKTGTTNDNRDSWFAGYSGDKVGVVWLGNDNNTSTGLTGSSGAMVAWGKIFAKVSTTPVADHPPEGITYQTVRFSSDSRQMVQIPYINNGDLPVQRHHKKNTITEDLDNMINSFIEIFQ